MWQKRTIPQQLKYASIVHLFKNKGNRYVADTEVSPWWWQQERSWCTSCSITLPKLSLNNSYQTVSGAVSREDLWKLLPIISFPEQFVIILQQFHDGMMAWWARVIENGDLSEPFPVRNGVKQGHVLAPTLFSILFAAMLLYGLDSLQIVFTSDGEPMADCSTSST